MTQHELIQFARHDEDLAAQFIALEADVLADVPTVAIDVDRVRARMHGGKGIRSVLERVEAWVYGAETGIRAFFRYWPMVAAGVFGACLFLMGRWPAAGAYRWLVGLAAISLGSIAVVCASSLWRRYPTQQDATATELPLRDDTRESAERRQ